MTTYQSQTVYTEDREGNSLAFSTVNQDGEEAVLKAAVDVTLPDGQQVLMNVLYTSADVAGLLAYLHDNFGGRGMKPLTKDQANEMLAEHGTLFPETPADLEYYVDPANPKLPVAGDLLNFQVGDETWTEQVDSVTPKADGSVAVSFVPRQADGPAPGRQCPVIYSGVQCELPEHPPTTLHSFLQEGLIPQNDAGAVPPPADAQGASNTPQPAGTGQSAAESATGATNTGAAPASASNEKPKRKRRTKLEITYDDALKAYSEDGSSEHAAALNQAHVALKAKDPGNSRLGEVTPGAAAPNPVQIEPAPVGFSPEQPITNSFQQPAPLAAGAQPVPGQIYAPDENGGIPAQVFGSVPAFQPGQAPELGQTQVSPEEQQAAQGFPCPVHASDGRPCLRPYGHELQTATNPHPKPHVYATTDPSQLGQAPQPQVTDPLPWAPNPQGELIPGPPNGPFMSQQMPTVPLQSVPFQVPPTPQAAPHPETNLQPPAPAAPSWAEPV